MKQAEKQKLEALTKERDELVEVIQKHQDRVNQLGVEIRKVHLEEYRRKLKSMGLEDGTAFIGFAKSCGYHYDMMKAIKVQSASKTPSFHSIQCVMAVYRADDYEFSFRTSKTSLSLREFAEFCDANIVYRVSVSDYNLIIERMAGLEVNFDNIDDLMTEIDSWEDSEEITRVKEIEEAE